MNYLDYSKICGISKALGMASTKLGNILTKSPLPICHHRWSYLSVQVGESIIIIGISLKKKLKYNSFPTQKWGSSEL